MSKIEKLIIKYEDGTVKTVNRISRIERKTSISPLLMKGLSVFTWQKEITEQYVATTKKDTFVLTISNRESWFDESVVFDTIIRD